MSNVQMLLSHLQWESDQSRGLLSTCPNPQTSLNSTGCFSAVMAAVAGRQSFSLCVVSEYQPNTTLVVNSDPPPPKKRERKGGETAWVTVQWQDWWKEEFLPHCVGDDNTGVAQWRTRMCFCTWGEFCAPSHPLSQPADWKLRGCPSSSSADMSVNQQSTL